MPIGCQQTSRVQRQLERIRMDIWKLEQLLTLASLPCSTCGQYFDRQRRDQVYCSKACAAPMRRAAKRKWWNENRGVGVSK